MTWVNGPLLVYENTLRCMCARYLRNRGAEHLAIQFFHRGKRWKTDTPEEAICLRQQLEAEDMRNVVPNDSRTCGPSGVWTPEVFASFLQTIGERQKAAVSLMAQHAGIGSAELAKRLNLESQVALAGVISGLSKQLKTLDLELGDLYTVKTKWTVRKKEELFFLRESFRRAADEARWKPKEKRRSLRPHQITSQEMNQLGASTSSGSRNSEED
jgi:hypothetical protein